MMNGQQGSRREGQSRPWRSPPRRSDDLDWRRRGPSEEVPESGARGASSSRSDGDQAMYGGFKRSPTADIFRYLSNNCRRSDFPHEISPDEYHFPFAAPHDEVQLQLDDYFGSVPETWLSCYCKNVFCLRGDHVEVDAREKVRAVVDSCVELLLNSNAKDSFINLTVSSIIYLANSGGPEEILTTHPVSFPKKWQLLPNRLLDGEKALLDLLRSAGAQEVAEPVSVPDDIYCVCFLKDFSNNGEKFGGTVALDPDDLSFSSWNSQRFMKNFTLCHPCERRDVDTDCQSSNLSLMVYLVDILRKCDLTPNQSTPRELTTPNFGGLVERHDVDAYRVKPNAGIERISEITHGIKYQLEMNGVRFSLRVARKCSYSVDHRSGKILSVRETLDCPEIQFSFPNDDDDLERYRETLTTVAEAIMKALESGSLRLKSGSHHFFNTRQEQFAVTAMQEMRRRIMMSDTLEGMLNAPADCSEEALRLQYKRMMAGIADGSVILPDQVIAKVKAAGRERGLAP